MSDIRLNNGKIFQQDAVKKIKDEEKKEEQNLEQEEQEEQNIEPGSVGVNDREGSLGALDIAAALAKTKVAEKTLPSARNASTFTTTNYVISGLKFDVDIDDKSGSFTYKIDGNKITFTAYYCIINITEVENPELEIEILGSNVTFNSNQQVKSITNNANKSVINGSDEADIIVDNSNGSKINAGKGDDSITSTGLKTTIYAGDGDDVINVSGAYADIHGEDGKDIVILNGSKTSVDLGDQTPATGLPQVDENGFDANGNLYNLKTGKLFNGFAQDGKLYEDGVLFYGVADDGLLYEEGILFSGFDEDGKLYVDGDYLTGVNQDGVWFKDGEIADKVVIDDTYYVDGHKAVGETFDENLLMMFVDGKPLTGVAGNNTLYIDGTKAIGLQEYDGKLYINGELANGKINDITYVDGVKQDSIDPAQQEYIDKLKAQYAEYQAMLYDFLSQKNEVFADIAKFAEEYAAGMNNTAVKIATKYMDTQGIIRNNYEAANFYNLLDNGYMIVGTNGGTLFPSPYLSHEITKTVHTVKDASQYIAISQTEYDKLNYNIKEVFVAGEPDKDGNTQYVLLNEISEDVYNKLSGSYKDCYASEPATKVETYWEVNPKYNRSIDAKDLQTLLVSGEAQIVTVEFFEFLRDKGGYDYPIGLLGGASYQELLDKWNSNNNGCNPDYKQSVIDWKNDITSTFKEALYTEDDADVLAQYEANTAKARVRTAELDMQVKNLEAKLENIEAELSLLGINLPDLPEAPNKQEYIDKLKAQYAEYQAMLYDFLSQKNEVFADIEKFAEEYNKGINNTAIKIAEEYMDTQGVMHRNYEAANFYNLLDNGYMIVGTNGGKLFPSPYLMQKHIKNEYNIKSYATTDIVLSKEEYDELYYNIKQAFVAGEPDKDGNAQYVLSKVISEDVYNKLPEQYKSYYNSEPATRIETSWEVNPEYNRSIDAKDLQALLVSGEAQIVTVEFLEFLKDYGAYDYSTGLLSGGSYQKLLDYWNSNNNGCNPDYKQSVIDWKNDTTSTFKEALYTEDDAAVMAQYEANVAKAQVRMAELDMQIKNLEAILENIEAELDALGAGTGKTGLGSTEYFRNVLNLDDHWQATEFDSKGRALKLEYVFKEGEPRIFDAPVTFYEISYNDKENTCSVNQIRTAGFSPVPNKEITLMKFDADGAALTPDDSYVDIAYDLLKKAGLYNQGLLGGGIQPHITKIVKDENGKVTGFATTTPGIVFKPYLPEEGTKPAQGFDIPTIETKYSVLSVDSGIVLQTELKTPDIFVDKEISLKTGKINYCFDKYNNYTGKAEFGTTGLYVNTPNTTAQMFAIGTDVKGYQTYSMEAIFDSRYFAEICNVQADSMLIKFNNGNSIAVNAGDTVSGVKTITVTHADGTKTVYDAQGVKISDPDTSSVDFKDCNNILGKIGIGIIDEKMLSNVVRDEQGRIISFVVTPLYPKDEPITTNKDTIKLALLKLQKENHYSVVYNDNGSVNCIQETPVTPGIVGNSTTTTEYHFDSKENRIGQIITTTNASTGPNGHISIRTEDANYVPIYEINIFSRRNGYPYASEYGLTSAVIQLENGSTISVKKGDTVQSTEYGGLKITHDDGTSEIIYATDNSISIEKYDKAGNRVFYSYKDSSGYVYEESSVYKNGQLSRTMYSQQNPDGTINKGLNLYYDNGNLKETSDVSYDADGLRIRDIIRNYDIDGNFVSETATLLVKPGEDCYADKLRLTNNNKKNATVSYTIDANGHMDLNASGLDIGIGLFYMTNFKSADTINITDNQPINVALYGAPIMMPPRHFEPAMENITINGDNNIIKGTSGDDNISVNGNNNKVDLADGDDTLNITGNNNTIKNVETINMNPITPPIEKLYEEVKTPDGKIHHVAGWSKLDKETQNAILLILQMDNNGLMSTGDGDWITVNTEDNMLGWKNITLTNNTMKNVLYKTGTWVNSSITAVFVSPDGINHYEVNAYQAGTNNTRITNYAVYSDQQLHNPYVTDTIRDENGTRQAIIETAYTDNGAIEYQRSRKYDERGVEYSDFLVGYDNDGNINYSVEDNFPSMAYPNVRGWGSDMAEILFSDDWNNKVVVKKGDKAVINEDGTVCITHADGSMNLYDINGVEIPMPDASMGSIEYFRNILNLDEHWTITEFDEKGRALKLEYILKEDEPRVFDAPITFYEISYNDKENTCAVNQVVTGGFSPKPYKETTMMKFSADGTPMTPDDPYVEIAYDLMEKAGLNTPRMLSNKVQPFITKIVKRNDEVIGFATTTPGIVFKPYLPLDETKPIQGIDIPTIETMYYVTKTDSGTILSTKDMERSTNFYFDKDNNYTGKVTYGQLVFQIYKDMATVSSYNDAVAPLKFDNSRQYFIVAEDAKGNITYSGDVSLDNYYFADFTDITPDSVTLLFNNGNTIKLVAGDKIYNEDGNIKVFHADGSESVYNAQGAEISDGPILPPGEVGSIEYAANLMGFDSKKCKVVATDEQGRVTQFIFTDKEDKIYTVQYNQDGSVVIEEPVGSTSFGSIRKFDTKGKFVEVEYSDISGNTNRIICPESATLEYDGRNFKVTFDKFGVQTLNVYINGVLNTFAMEAPQGDNLNYPKQFPLTFYINENNENVFHAESLWYIGNQTAGKSTTVTVRLQGKFLNYYGSDADDNIIVDSFGMHVYTNDGNDNVYMTENSYVNSTDIYYANMIIDSAEGFGPINGNGTDSISGIIGTNTSYYYMETVNGVNVIKDEYAKYLDEKTKDALLKNPQMMRMNSDLEADINLVIEAEKYAQTQPDFDSAYTNYIKNALIKTWTNQSEEEILNSTNVGDIIQKNNTLYVKNGNNQLKELKISAETYLELFPPIDRYMINQSDYLGDCYFVSGGLIDCMKNPAAFAELLQLFREENGNLTVTFNNIYDSDNELINVNFPAGELFAIDGIDGQGKSLIENPSDFDQVDGAKGIKMIEQAYAIAKFTAESEAEIDNLDIDEALFYIGNGGWQHFVYDDIFADCDVQTISTDSRYNESALSAVETIRDMMTNNPDELERICSIAKRAYKTLTLDTALIADDDICNLIIMSIRTGINVWEKFDKMNMEEFNSELNKLEDSLVTDFNAELINSYADMLEQNPNTFISVANTTYIQGFKDIYAPHAYSLKNIDKENRTVTLINPWQNGVEITYTYDEFIQFFSVITVCNLNPKAEDSVDFA